MNIKIQQLGKYIIIIFTRSNEHNIIQFIFS